jgi:hypothetical protein
MGGKGGGNNNAAAMARADEQARQDKIRNGTSRINAIFDGGVPPPMANGPGGEMIAAPANPMAGFNDRFYKNRRDSFTAYAKPQLDEQYGDANKQLTYALARSGLLDSSVRAEKGAELQKKYDLNNQQIADQALSYENDARNNVEKSRSDLITMLNATGDADGAANSALARSTALSAPQAFSPLTNLFSDFTSGLALQGQYERANALGGTGAGQPKIGRYDTGLFSNANSVVNKR